MRRPGLIVLAAALFAVLLASGCGAATSDNPNLTMGNPSRAVADPAVPDNYLIANDYFALSYNSPNGTPNWVSWRLAKSDIGDADRTSFYAASDLPAGFQVITPSDYTNSGFDRGHMCPHADRSASDAMSKSTFVMTNIVPQSPTLNQQPWEELESYCRDLVRKGKVLYIISGPLGKGGTGSKGPAKAIGTANTVTVPARCWKVIMVLRPGKANDAARVTSRTRLIAVVMPSTMKVKTTWQSYRVSVADVEKLTGYKLFNAVAPEIIDPLKRKVDRTRIPRKTRTHGGSD